MQTFYEYYSKTRNYTSITKITYYSKALFSLGCTEINFNNEKDEVTFVETH
jgi:hypothetical protein